MNQSIPVAPTPPRRVRLKPWLVAQVNSCQYPGLQWVNGEKKLFCIPWRHATRHGPSQDGDNTIFKAWAKETGKYTEGVDEADPAKWKANLRCALNKSRDFRLIYDGPRDMPPQPYKIYEVCSNGPAPTDSQPPEDYSFGAGEEEEEEEELQRMLPSLSLTDAVQSGPHMTPYSLLKEDVKWPPTLQPPTLRPPTLQPPTLQPPVVLGPPAPDPSPLAPPPGNPAGFRELLSEVLEPGPLPASLPPAGEQLLPDLLISPHMLPLTDLEIKFQYRGRPPRALTISNPHGCRLFYSQLEATQEQVELFGPISLEQVRFPSPEDIPSDKQRFYTNQLLDVLDRGLILQLQGQDLYAIRLCQCKVFWSGPCASAHDSCPNPIQREVKTKLFSLEHFLNELILFQKGQTNTPPPFEIFFCFGEEWPDRKPREKKLITVQVVPVAARLLLEMFSGELSWSADSIRLQISNPDLKDRMVEQFKELHHIWQSQQRLQPVAQAPPGAGLGVGQGPWPMHPAGMQ
ncbi:interferon regulatory factor 5 isoform d [Homo sapiens]|uniref:Isoform 2 of Interferon regulatory factor 5 n=2 Tax=Homo sapiens TaxID=9606 RepID=Q13568-2|nr:interferon regulatory factor 5 isoform d [Homo sapiens]NP_001334857.1 interferon regulatory factor 5 isoform d [Homo sapiens]NP_001351243.1 interferon regulatory factor 5 isoform d [Homo sapiens]XP_006716037.1 interferon regulatory factor 5 isoform X1 [Homo sapiens]XP_011514460.1 interferon regulatory factor 5 isoform X1 [Homo sapiens]XP_011514461.1 interferon regulatory factor 5 isoform X1 [Homo sapiens]XP_011514462.1 interferon regulatory factor 5 isoform X1 [Homo sapiens]XP_047276292.1|eukprot:NP_001092099.1 interferon regulatory factor 5 isoform d [Homo sapiens]